MITNDTDALLALTEQVSRLIELTSRQTDLISMISDRLMALEEKTYGSNS